MSPFSCKHERVMSTGQQRLQQKLERYGLQPCYWKKIVIYYHDSLIHPGTLQNNNKKLQIIISNSTSSNYL